MAESDPGVTDGEQPLPTLLPAEAIPMPKSNDHPCPRGLGQDDLTKEKGITQTKPGSRSAMSDRTFCNDGHVLNLHCPIWWPLALKCS